MTLRDLLKKAKNDPNNDEGYAQMFDKALHNCAPELLAVVEETEKLARSAGICADLLEGHYRIDAEILRLKVEYTRAALADLREKEEKL